MVDLGGEWLQYRLISSSNGGQVLYSLNIGISFTQLAFFKLQLWLQAEICDTCRKITKCHSCVKLHIQVNRIMGSCGLVEHDVRIIHHCSPSVQVQSLFVYNTRVIDCYCRCTERPVNVGFKHNNILSHCATNYVFRCYYCFCVVLVSHPCFFWNYYTDFFSCSRWRLCICASFHCCCFYHLMK